ncbi:thiol-disulfide oxidoreductase DCC family protein [Bacillus sp. WMMC1349]|uniref:thiol-disulfide oxidoreductase DCC family protein n=1 Tax=Bacillus sp. WMMC1349 TaxID=2736254 RepID=UPI0015553587|nr:DCC1-like thiol-disulfide oxidoreductase family protein [Bacillus sp. WMMC1349]NPC93963.1 thiol-disulfide oxidoreductase DCC family protein [Bacillus sp. WMMC1349]
MKHDKEPERIILFDGVCNLCDRSVQFVIKHDPEGLFSFASLQSDIGQKLLKKYHLPVEHFDSLILIKAGQTYRKSTAVLHIVKSLPGLWRYLSLFLVIPRPLRDSVYSLIAKYRHKWFGKKDKCLIPDRDIKKRFLS